MHIFVVSICSLLAREPVFAHEDSRTKKQLTRGATMSMIAMRESRRVDMCGEDVDALGLIIGTDTHLVFASSSLSSIP